MSYIVGRGKQAVQDSERDQQSTKDLLKRVPKPGQSPLIVKLLGEEDFVKYAAHTVFKPRITTTPCSKPAGKDDLYDKAAAMMFDDIKAEADAGAIDEDEVKERNKHAAQLLPKMKYLFGFIDLSTGEPIIVELTENQGIVIAQAIEKYGKYADKKAFELGKSGAGMKTTAFLSPVMELEELTKEQQANFDKAKGKEFDAGLFEKLFRFKSDDEQAQDLITFGFDVKRLGIDPATLDAKSNEGGGTVTNTDDVAPEDIY